MRGIDFQILNEKNKKHAPKNNVRHLHALIDFIQVRVNSQIIS